MHLRVAMAAKEVKMRSNERCDIMRSSAVFCHPVLNGRPRFDVQVGSYATYNIQKEHHARGIRVAPALFVGVASANIYSDAVFLVTRSISPATPVSRSSTCSNVSYFRVYLASRCNGSYRMFSALPGILLNTCKG